MRAGLVRNVWRSTGGWAVLAVWLWGGWNLGAGDLPGLGSTAGLGERIDQHISQERFGPALWGIKIVSLRSGQTLYEHNAGRLLKPASNAKLFTGALALDRLGPEYRIETSLYAERRPNRSGTLQGDLIIFGRGDPSMAARFNGGDYDRSLGGLVAAVRQAGIRRIKGDLVGDESFFRGAPYGAGWTWDDLQYYYGAAVSALTVDDNTVDLRIEPGAAPGIPCPFRAEPWPGRLEFSNRTGTVPADGRAWIDIERPLCRQLVVLSGQLPLGGEPQAEAVTVPEPAAWFVGRLRRALLAAGIVVEGRTRTVDWRQRDGDPLDGGKWVELGSVESRPLSEILEGMMKPSQNLYAQLLLLQVGARYQGNKADGQTTEALGLAAMKPFLAEAGITPGSVLLEEGSGLSRAALLTPNATVALLRFMDQHRWREVFQASLPVAGVDGTLRRRFRGTAAQGRVLAKTGSLRYVNALSGYATTLEGERLAFSIMLNNYPEQEGKAAARADLDRVVLLMLGAEQG